jgi:hypothetical protein
VQSHVGNTAYLHKVQKPKIRINSNKESVWNLKNSDNNTCIWYFYVGELMTVKSILADIRDSDTNFHDGKETLRLVLCDIGFSYGKFHVVKELKQTNRKQVTRNSFSC